MTATAPRNMHGYSFGTLFHTGLRKGSDTDWSVVLWNFIHMLSDSEDGKKEWNSFCERGDHEYAAGASLAAIMADWGYTPGEARTHTAITFRRLLTMCDAATIHDLEMFFHATLVFEAEQEAKG